MPAVLDSPDVLVVGAGASGAVAATVAARCGADVLLIDRLPFLGGTSTAVLDTFYGFYTPGDRTRTVVSGVPREVVHTLEKLGPVIERPNTYGAGTGITYQAEHLKIVWERMTRAAGVRVLLLTAVYDATQVDGRVHSLTVGTTAGLAEIRPNLVIDASGDAVVAHFAGFGYEQAGTVSPAQTLTTTFRMINVDAARRKTVSTQQFHELMAAAADCDYQLPRRSGSDHITPVAGMTATVMTRLDSVVRGGPDNTGTLTTTADPWFRSAAEMDGREQALEYARFLIDKVPGYEHASIGALGTQIGIRESRRVYGDYRVTRDDVLGARQFDDQVGLCGAPLEDHHSGEGTAWAYIPDSRTVGIPAGALIVRDATNVLVSGRCFSATHDAHASIRSMAQCMAMGQAVGTWAALAAEQHADLRSLPAATLRDTLREDGAIVDEPA